MSKFRLSEALYRMPLGSLVYLRLAGSSIAPRRNFFPGELVDKAVLKNPPGFPYSSFPSLKQKPDAPKRASGGGLVEGELG